MTDNQPLPQQEPLDSRFSYLLAILHAVARIRPVDTAAVRTAVSGAVQELVRKRGHSQENFAESFNKRHIGVDRDQFYSLVLSALQGNPEPLEKQIRSVDTYARQLATGDGEERLKQTLNALRQRPNTMTSGSLEDLFASFWSALEGSGFHSSRDSASAFFASVLAKPLVILTGLAGSGKTQLAKRFGQWLGSERLLVVPVRPDWTGPEALLGYEDALRSAEPAIRGALGWFPTSWRSCSELLQAPHLRAPNPLSSSLTR